MKIKDAALQTELLLKVFVPQERGPERQVDVSIMAAGRDVDVEHVMGLIRERLQIK